MHTNDNNLKKTATHIGIALLAFLGLYYALVRGVYILISAIVISLELDRVVSSIIIQLSQGILYCAAFVVPAIIYKALSRKNKKDLCVRSNLSPTNTILTVIAAISIISTAAYINSWLVSIFGIQQNIAQTSEPSSWVDFLLLTFTLAIVPAFCEEILFRKTILGALLPYGEGFAIISSALIFGLMHQNILQIFYTTMAGIVIGYAYAKTRSYLCVFLIHFVNNFTSVIQEIIYTNLSDPYATFLIAIMSATILLSGAISVFVLMIKEKNRKDIYATGSFEKILLPSENFVKKKTSFNCTQKLFSSPCVMIFTIICILLCIFTAFI